MQLKGSCYKLALLKIVRETCFLLKLFLPLQSGVVDPVVVIGESSRRHNVHVKEHEGMVSVRRDLR